MCNNDSYDTRSQTQKARAARADNATMTNQRARLTRIITATSSTTPSSAMGGKPVSYPMADAAAPLRDPTPTHVTQVKAKATEDKEDP